MKIALLITDNREAARRYDLPSPLFGPAPSALLEGLASCKNFSFHVVSCVQKPLESPTRLYENINFHAVRVPKSGWLRSGYLGCVLAVRRRLQEISPDLVHAQGSERDCAMEACMSGFSNLLTLHGNIRSVARSLKAPRLSYYGIQSLLEAWSIRRSNLVLCNSSYTRSLVSPLNSHNIMVPNAVRLGFFAAPRSSPAPPSPGLRLLMVGSILSYKQPLEFLRFLRDWKQGPDCPVKDCVWVGSADERDPYARTFLREMQAAQSLGWATHIQHLDQDLLIHRMDSADLLVHLPTEEAFGLVVAEAMIRGLPIVASRAGGLPDFSLVYPNLQLVSPGEPREWRQAIASARPGGDRVALDQWPSSTYHPETVANQHCRIYEGMVNSARVKN